MNSPKGGCNKKALNADSDLVVSVYIHLLEDVPFSSRKPKMTSTNVPSRNGIIPAGEVHRTSHPGFTEDCAGLSFNMHSDNLTTQGQSFGSSIIK